MTDDVTRGLTMLADEAEPAPIDSSDVITRARARTRNRRATLTTAVATLAVVGSLAVTLNRAHDSTDAAAGGQTPEEQLTTQLQEAMPKVIPSRWTPVSSAVPEFHCLQTIPGHDEPTAEPRVGQCSAEATYVDSAGQIDLVITVTHSSAAEMDCTGCGAENLPDGTLTAATLSPVSEETGQRDQGLRALRPNGTRASIQITYEAAGSTPLTNEELEEWATVFSL